MTTPLAAQFQITALVAAFLSSNFLTAVVFLAILASMLVLSLMLADVDGKTYEYGMLRALGFMKRHLMAMITLNSFSFSLPGLFLGVIVAFIINLALREVIFLLAKNTMGYDLTATALALGISFGLLMPFLANYLPIKSAMGKTLRDSLDLNKRKGDKFGVKVEKLEDLGMSFNQFVVAILLTGVGFTTYYFVPLAFLNQNYTVAFLLLSFILELVVIGLTFLCTLLFSSVERALLWVTLHTCCRRDKRFYTVVIKNMDGHSRRNNKTSVMFTLAISFLIFAQSAFKVISTVILVSGEQIVGADILATSTTGLLDEGPLRRFLEKNEKKSDGAGPVSDFCFATAGFDAVQEKSLDGGGFDLGISDVNYFDMIGGIQFKGVPTNFFNVTGTEVVVVDSY